VARNGAWQSRNEFSQRPSTGRSARTSSRSLSKTSLSEYPRNILLPATTLEFWIPGTALQRKVEGRSTRIRMHLGILPNSILIFYEIYKYSNFMTIFTFLREKAIM